MAIIRGGNYPGDNCPGGNCPRAVVWGAIIRVLIIRGGNYLGGNCPGTVQSIDINNLKLLIREVDTFALLCISKQKSKIRSSSSEKLHYYVNNNACRRLENSYLRARKYALVLQRSYISL